ncbi:MAG: ribose-5-phosphate isomerase RpiA [Deltaproteobacteria bacterium]|jgi:ribose 5-phosphate isomerase A|nr:ribose-5-phosphate isomerase RpiA [Deltaproteobacteria bacterium]
MDNLKSQVASEIAKRVKTDEIIGLGSGSTVWLAIEEIGRRIRQEKLNVSALVASKESEIVAKEQGLNVLPLASEYQAVWGFDGADEVDENLNLLKGGWGAQTKEKILARRCGSLVIIIDASKLVKNLGKTMAVPVEILPEAKSIVEPELIKLGATSCQLRSKINSLNKELFTTEYNNLLLDVAFSIPLTIKLEQQINAITGVVENGLFFNLATEVLVATQAGIKSLLPPSTTKSC